MGNLLREIFSDEEKEGEFVGKIVFKSEQARQEFENALKEVFKTGNRVSLGNVGKTSMEFVDAKSKYPIQIDKEWDAITIEPSVESIELDVGDTKLILNKIELDESIRLYNSEKSPLAYKLEFRKDSDKVDVSYKRDINKASSINEIYEAYLEFAKLVGIVFGDQDEEDILVFRKEIQISTRYFSILYRIEKLFNIAIAPETIPDYKDNLLIEKINCLLLRKETIKSYDRLKYITHQTSDENKHFDEFKEGVNLIGGFIREDNYDLFGHTVVIYTVNYVFNAVISKIEIVDDNSRRVYFRDAKVGRMYISYSGFLNNEDAKKELDEAMDKLNQYKDAKLIDELIDEDMKKFNPDKFERGETSGEKNRLED